MKSHESDITTKSHECDITKKSHEGDITTKSHEGDITTKSHEGDIMTKSHKGDNTINEGDSQITRTRHPKGLVHPPKGPRPAGEPHLAGGLVRPPDLRPPRPQPAPRPLNPPPLEVACADLVCPS
jgi:hypothetical protein